MVGCSACNGTRAVILGPPFNGQLPVKLPGWTALTAMMPKTAGSEWDVQTLKRHAKDLAENRADITA